MKNVSQAKPSKQKGRRGIRTPEGEARRYQAVLKHGRTTRSELAKSKAAYEERQILNALATALNLKPPSHSNKDYKPPTLESLLEKALMSDGIGKNLETGVTN